MPKPDRGVNVRSWRTSDVRTHDGELMPYTASYARLERWVTQCACGQGSVTRRRDLTYGCVRCGATRQKEEAA